MTAALLAIASAQLALFTLVCGAILWELRRARLEANQRGREGQDLTLVLEEELRRIRKGERALQGARGDGS